MPSGALLNLEGPARRVEGAVPVGLTALGYTSGEGLDVTLYAGERGAWLRLSVPPAVAHALATRLAGALGRPVRLFTAHQPLDDGFDLDLADDLVRADGARAPTPGSLARELTAEYGEDWGDVCDHKPYFLLDSVLDSVLETVAPAAEERRTSYAPPPTLGDAKLDALAAQIRVAARVAFTEVEGRACVQVHTWDGATVTTFLPQASLDRLRGMLPGA